MKRRPFSLAASAALSLLAAISAAQEVPRTSEAVHAEALAASRPGGPPPESRALVFTSTADPAVVAAGAVAAARPGGPPPESRALTLAGMVDPAVVAAEARAVARGTP